MRKVEVHNLVTFSPPTPPFFFFNFSWSRSMWDMSHQISPPYLLLSTSWAGLENGLEKEHFSGWQENTGKQTWVVFGSILFQDPCFKNNSWVFILRPILLFRACKRDISIISSKLLYCADMACTFEDAIWPQTVGIGQCTDKHDNIFFKGLNLRNWNWKFHFKVTKF